MAKRKPLAGFQKKPKPKEKRPAFPFEAFHRKPTPAENAAEIARLAGCSEGTVEWLLKQPDFIAWEKENHGERFKYYKFGKGDLYFVMLEAL